MRLPIVTSLLTTLFLSGCAVGQTNKAEEDHAAHHPAGTTAQVATPPAPEATERQMKAMQEMHRKMQVAKTPAERAALMDEHMKLMHSGMAMMGQMRGGGPGGMGGPGAMPMMPPSSQSVPQGPTGSGSQPMGPGPGTQGMPGGMQGTPGMMGMHMSMERRMAMMEQMMQMMVDREAAMPRK
ncbi:MAG: hypothetical protein V4731_05995 [Pseudomonadota bacterium]